MKFLFFGSRLARMRLNAKRRIENAANNAKKFAARQEVKDGAKPPTANREKDREK